MPQYKKKTCHYIHYTYKTNINKQKKKHYSCVSAAASNYCHGAKKNKRGWRTAKQHDSEGQKKYQTTQFLLHTGSGMSLCHADILSIYPMVMSICIISIISQYQNAETRTHTVHNI